MRRVLIIMSAWLFAVCGAASAATGNINFSGTVLSTCTLLVTSGTGTLAVSPSLASLSSLNLGGTPGLVTLTTTGGVTLSVDPVTVSTQPPADLNATTWSPSYSLTGLQTVSERTSPTTVAAAGLGVVTVNLTGTKSGSNTFVNGNYTATVTVRCEP